MATLVKTGKYGANIIADKIKMGNFIIKFFSEFCTHQKDTTYDVQISTYGEPVVKYQYTKCILKTKWYWEQ